MKKENPSAAVVVDTQALATLPIARQIMELQTALSINRSDLARILGASRPTVRDWLDGREPNPDNRSRIRGLLRLLSESRVSANNPLFPRFVTAPLEPGNQVLLDLLSEEKIDEATAKNLILRAKALGDASDAEREQRETRLREAGFEEPDQEQRRANLAMNVALMTLAKRGVETAGRHSLSFSEYSDHHEHRAGTRIDCSASDAPPTVLDWEVGG